MLPLRRVPHYMTALSNGYFVRQVHEIFAECLILRSMSPVHRSDIVYLELSLELLM